MFVRYFYPELDIFNFELPVLFMDKELEQMAPDGEFMADSKTVDKLLSIKTSLEVSDPILLLVEVQGYADHHFAERVYRNFARLMDKYGKRILVLVIYTDRIKKYKPSAFRYSISDTVNSFTFRAYKVTEQNTAKLADNPNLFSLIVLTVRLAIEYEIKGDDDSLLRMKIRLLNNLKKRNLPKNQEAKLLTFINLYVDFEKQPMRDKFEEQKDRIIGKTKDMGIIEFAIQEAASRAAAEAAREGLKQGVEQERKALVKRLLIKKTYSLQEIADIAQVPEDFIRALQ